MNTRDYILASVRRNQPAATPLPEIPDFGRDKADPLADFTEALARMGGAVIEPPAGPLDAFLAERSRRRVSSVRPRRSAGHARAGGGERSA